MWKDDLRRAMNPVPLQCTASDFSASHSVDAVIWTWYPTIAEY